MEKIIGFFFVLFVLVSFGACGENGMEYPPEDLQYAPAPSPIAPVSADVTPAIYVHFEDFYDLLNASDYILMGQLLPSGNISVREVFKGEINRRGSLPLDYHVFGYTKNLLAYWEYYIIFLTSSNGLIELANPHQSVFRMCCCYFRSGFPAIHEGDASFNIYATQLVELLNEKIQQGFAAPPLEIETRRVHSGFCCCRIIELPEYPTVITSMEDLAKYLSHYTGNAIFYSSNPDGVGLIPHFFGDVVFYHYTEEFFEENFLIILFFGGTSSSVGFVVDAVLENGDIHVSVFNQGYHTDDVTSIHILIYACNSHIPETFTLHSISRWF